MKTSLGGTCQIALPDGRSFAPGEKVGIVVRPEDIEVAAASSANDADSFTGKLRRSSFLGQIYDLQVKVGESELRCQALKGNPPASEDVSLHIRPNAWHILDD